MEILLLFLRFLRNWLRIRRFIGPKLSGTTSTTICRRYQPIIFYHFRGNHDHPSHVKILSFNANIIVQKHTPLFQENMSRKYIYSSLDFTYRFGPKTNQNNEISTLPKIYVCLKKHKNLMRPNNFMEWKQSFTHNEWIQLLCFWVSRETNERFNLSIK